MVPVGSSSATRSEAKVPSQGAEKRADKPLAGHMPTSKVSNDEAKAQKKGKTKKAKLVRDSFTIPEREYELFAALKKRCLARGLAVKKSEVLRAAIIGFAAQSDSAVTKALRAVEVLKTGRPPKAQW